MRYPASWRTAKDPISAKDSTFCGNGESKKKPREEPIPGRLRAVDRASQQLLRVMARRDFIACREEQGTTIPRLLLRAFPDRIAKRREEGDGRFILCQGRGVRLPSTSRLAKSPFIIAAHVDAGEKAEGMVHLSEPVAEDLLREELSGSIESIRRVEWDKREGRIIATLEEKLGALQLSAKPFAPKEEEAALLLCEAVRSGSARIVFSEEARQLQGRVSLMKRTFPTENWPDLSETRLLSVPEEWLMPWLKGIRTREKLATLDLLPSLRSPVVTGTAASADRTRTRIPPRAERSPGNPGLRLRRYPDPGRKAAGDVRPDGHSENCRRAGEGAPPSAVSGPQTGSGDPRPEGLLEQRVPAGEEGVERALPETSLAG